MPLAGEDRSVFKKAYLDASRTEGGGDGLSLPRAQGFEASAQEGGDRGLEALAHEAAATAQSGDGGSPGKAGR